MSQPPAYNRITDFSADEANSVAGRSTVRTEGLDVELDNIKATLDVMITNFSVIQRDDTELRDGIVKPHTLSSDVLLLMGSNGWTPHNPIGWLTATAYVAKEVVTQAGGTYVCVVSHTSGTFATDLAAGKWVLIYSSTTLSAAAITNTPAGNIAAANVQAAINELDTEKLAIALLTGKGTLIGASAASTPGTLAAGTDYQMLRARAGATVGFEWASVGGSRVLGATCVNNAGTPNTQFDMDADEVHLRDANGSSVVVVNPGAAITNNVSTAGPAANGRDQAGAFGAGSWVHFYWIWGTSVGIATVSSATAPTTGPTLPTNYTHFAYAGAVRFNGSSQLLKTHIRGAWCFYRDRQSALANGTASVETAVSLSTLVPPNALAIQMAGRFANVTGNISQYSSSVRVFSGSTFFTFEIGAETAGGNACDSGAFIAPNVSQQVYYANDNGNQRLDLYVTAYSVANGG